MKVVRWLAALKSLLHVIRRDSAPGNSGEFRAFLARRSLVRVVIGHRTPLEAIEGFKRRDSFLITG